MKNKIPQKTQKTISTSIFIISITLFPLIYSFDQNCTPNCIKCKTRPNKDGSTGCLACATGYRLLEAKCIRCEIEGCAHCNENTARCSLCYTGWFNSSSPGEGSITEIAQCSPCQENCMVCNKKSFCEVCKEGFKYFQGKKIKEKFQGKKSGCYEQSNSSLYAFFVVLFLTVVILSFVFMRRFGYFMSEDKKKYFKEKKEEGKEKKKVLKMLKKGDKMKAINDGLKVGSKNVSLRSIGLRSDRSIRSGRKSGGEDVYQPKVKGFLE